jgi:PAS domain S-box-containing protein
MEKILKKARILVLDDEVGPREALRMVLKARYEVITTSTGSEALDVVHRDPPDVAFLDIQMREMNGLEVLKAIKQIDDSIEVIMMTAYASLETAREAMSHGVSEYLIKPFSKHDIEQAVNKALARRQARTGRQKEVRTLLEQMRALTDTSTQGASYQDFIQNTTVLLEQSRPTLHASTVALYVASGPGQWVCEIVCGGERHRGFAEEAWCQALGTVMAGGHPARLASDASEFFLRDQVLHLQSMGYEGGVLFPIHAGQEALGMLAFFYETAAAIPSQWLELGQPFPNLLALAIRSHQRYREAQQETAQQAQRIAQLSILREMARVIMDKLDLQDMLLAIGEQLQAGLGYTGFHVWLQDQHAEGYQYVYGSGDAPTWQPEDLGELHELQEREVGQVVGPLVLEGRHIGAISLLRGSHQERLAAFEVELIRMVLEYLSMAVKNSQLYGEMKETKGYLENLINSAGDAIITVDTAGVITSWNAAAERIFCMPHADAIRHPLSQLCPDAPEQIAWLFDVMSDCQVRHVETRLQQQDGSLIDCRLTLSPLWGAHDEVVGVSAIIQDVTQDKKLREQLMQSEKLSALGEMAAGVAHNFKNILGTILGYAEYLREAPDDREEVEEGLSIIEKAARDATQVVQRIQTYARCSSDADELESTDLRQLVKETVEITRPIWKEQAQQQGKVIDVSLELDDIPLVRSRSAEIREVVTNLIINAVDAIARDGSLTLSTYQDGAYACIRVTDTGAGMTEAVQRRVFDPFFTTKGKRGTGLGLSVSHTQLKGHGGEIELESAPGVGTSFTVKLPI